MSKAFRYLFLVLSFCLRANLPQQCSQIHAIHTPFEVHAIRLEMHGSQGCLKTVFKVWLVQKLISYFVGMLYGVEVKVFH